MLKRALIVVLALNASLLAQGDPHQRPPQQPLPEAAQPFVKEFQEKLQARDIKGALEALGKAIAAAPAEKRLWYTRGDILIKLRRWTEAVADLTKVIELDGAMSLAWRLRGFARQQLKEMENAGKDFTKVVELAPGNADSYLYRARLRSMTGELEGALADYNKVTELAAEWGPGYLSRAEVFSALGKYKEAMEDYDNAMFLLEGAAQAGVLMNRARTKFHMGDAEGAAKDATAAIQTAPGHERHFSRGLLRHDMGDYKGCIEDMRKAIELDGKNTHEYGRFYIALSQMRLGQAEAAAKEMGEYLDQREAKDDWFVNVGGFLAGRVSAEDLLAAAKNENAQLTREQSLEVHWYIAGSQLAKGDKESAKRNIEAALKIRIHQFIEFQSAVAEAARLAKG